MGKILVVEDSLTQAIRLEYLLTENGYEVERAPDGKQAFAILQDAAFDLVISDVTMPVMDGFELCSAIKAHDDLKTIPVMLLTNLSEANHIVHGLNSMADGYVTKPYDDQFLLNRIEYYLNIPVINKIENFEVNEPFEVEIMGKKYEITAGRRHILNLVLSTYENSMIQNRMLEKNQRELEKLNQRLTESLQELKFSEDRFKSLVQTIPDIVYKIDNEGLFTFLNDAVERLGWNKAELLGQHFSAMLNPDDVINVSRESVLQTYKGEIPASQPKLFDEMRTGERITSGLELKLLKKSTSRAYCGAIDLSIANELFVEINSAGLYGQYEGEQKRYLGTVGVIRDITQRKKFETELRKAREAAEHFSAAKSNFLANMSHEIRTPMNAVINFAELALETEHPSEQTDYLEKINFSAKSLLGIINDILDFSKIEAGKLSLEERCFDLHELFDKITLIFADNARQKNISLLIDIAPDLPRAVSGDLMRLYQIMSNLVSNALKFTKAGQIIVGATVMSLKKEMVMIKFFVSDSGVGISAENLDMLFDAFSQADSSTARKFGGTGLGLAICKKLTSLMGGEVIVESEIGKGSTFSFTVNLALDQQKRVGSKEKVSCDGAYHFLPGSVEETAAAMAAVKGARILLVEDNAINQQVAMEIMAKANIHVEIATNGQEAIEAVAVNDYDAILMDLQMPDMDGYEATRKIRQELLKTDLPIIAMTAHAMDEERQKCLQCGMNDHIAKPIDRNRLFVVLACWIKSKFCRVPTTIDPGAACENKGSTSVMDFLAGAECTLPPGLNIQEGLGRLGGNKKLYLKLLKVFCREQQGMVAEIENNFAAGDLDTAKRLAHTLKGVAGNLGMQDIMSAAGRVEKACGASEMEIKRNLIGLTVILTPVLDFLSQHVEENSSEDNQVTISQNFDRQDALGILQDFMSLLKKADFTASQFLEENRPRFKPLFDNNSLDVLSGYVDSYKFAEALELIKSKITDCDL